MKSQTNPLKTLEKIIGVSFQNKKKLILALTHSSYKYDMGEPIAHEADIVALDNERLEFFGDAILSFIISKKLFSEFPDVNEGTLSKFRSLLVSRKLLFTIAKKMKLHQYLYLGKGEQNIKFRDKAKMMADGLEAIIGAIYCDRGMKMTEEFIARHFNPYINLRKLRQLDSTENYKSKLQEYCQKQFQVIPQYKHEHADDIFTSTAYIKRKAYGTGQGRSKRIAEKEAAKKTLQLFRVQKKAGHKDQY